MTYNIYYESYVDDPFKVMEQNWSIVNEDNSKYIELKNKAADWSLCWYNKDTQQIRMEFEVNGIGDDDEIKIKNQEWLTGFTLGLIELVEEIRKHEEN